MTDLDRGQYISNMEIHSHLPGASINGGEPFGSLWDRGAQPGRSANVARYSGTTACRISIGIWQRILLTPTGMRGSLSPTMEEIELPKAAIVDLDGTLLDSVDRDRRLRTGRGCSAFMQGRPTKPL